MYTLIIPLHSFVDIITNSSTEIYVAADEGTINAIKEIVNDILKLGDCKCTFDDYFTADVVWEVEYEKNGKYRCQYHTEDEIEANIESGLYTEDDVRRTKGEGEYSGSDIRIRSKTDLELPTKIAKALSGLESLFNINAERNG